MNILVLNVGSSSIKFTVYSNSSEHFKGRIERIDEKGKYIIAMKQVFNVLEQNKIKVDAIGHRVVHGGEIKKSCRIDAKLLQKLRKISCLAPLHNIPELDVICYCAKRKIPQVAVFDTSFHQTMPKKAYLYGLPLSLAKKGIRKYGFHGISVRFIIEKCGTKGKTIVCHLGAGSSVTAVVNGKSVDTSMGLTPLEGLVMGTRCGDIDPGIILYLAEQMCMGVTEIDHVLNYESGLKGLCGKSDMRDLLHSKDEKAKTAIEIYCYNVAKKIGSYAAAMNGVDTIVFTAGIGENAWKIREKICSYLDFLGVKLDNEANRKSSDTISKKASRVKVRVIPTDEEREIFEETRRIVGSRK